jgi:hypothetical protein
MVVEKKTPVTAPSGGDIPWLNLQVKRYDVSADQVSLVGTEKVARVATRAGTFPPNTPADATPPVRSAYSTIYLFGTPSAPPEATLGEQKQAKQTITTAPPQTVVAALAQPRRSDPG